MLKLKLNLSLLSHKFPYLDNRNAVCVEDLEVNQEIGNNEGSVFFNILTSRVNIIRASIEV